MKGRGLPGLSVNQDIDLDGSGRGGTVSRGHGAGGIGRLRSHLVAGEIPREHFKRLLNALGPVVLRFKAGNCIIEAFGCTFCRLFGLGGAGGKNFRSGPLGGGRLVGFFGGNAREFLP